MCLQVKPSWLLGDELEPTALPYKACPTGQVLGGKDGPSGSPARERNLGLGCSRTPGQDRGTRITPRKTQSRLTRERCSGRTEKRRGPSAPE